MKLGNFLRDRRKALDLSVKDVVDRLKGRGVEVSAKTIYSWESDHRQPDADTFLLLCQIYGVDSFSELNLNRPTLTLTDKLDILMAERNINRAELAEASGVPYTTIMNFYTKGTDNIKRSTLLRLANYFGVSLSYLGDDNIDDLEAERVDNKAKKAPAVSAEAKNIARIFDSLDAHGKDMVKVVAEREHARMETEAAANTDMEAAPATKTIPLFGASFAAGKGEPDFGNMWEDYEVPVDTKADFAVKINGDSMEPYLHDGSIALGLRQTPKDGDVAALLLDGEFLVKQVCQDMYDNVYLFSLNRKRSDADVTIWHDSGRSLSCFGTIIMEEDVPLPQS